MFRENLFRRVQTKVHKDILQNNLFKGNLDKFFIFFSAKTLDIMNRVRKWVKMRKLNQQPADPLIY